MSTEPATPTAEGPTGTIEISHRLVDDRLGEIELPREVDLAELFGETDRLVLFSDGCGWNGIVHENGQFYHVNRRHHDDEPVSKTRLSIADLKDKLESHIADPHAGGVGTFATGCSPP